MQSGKYHLINHGFSEIDQLLQEASPYKSLKHGEQMGRIAEKLENIFDKIIQGGKQVGNNRWEMPDGDLLTRYSAKSGGKTLQINTGDVIF